MGEINGNNWNGKTDFKNHGMEWRKTNQRHQYCWGNRSFHDYMHWIAFDTYLEVFIKLGVPQSPLVPPWKWLYMFGLFWAHVRGHPFQVQSELKLACKLLWRRSTHLPLTMGIWFYLCILCIVVVSLGTSLQAATLQTEFKECLYVAQRPYFMA